MTTPSNSPATEILWFHFPSYLSREKTTEAAVKGRRSALWLRDPDGSLRYATVPMQRGG